MPIFITYLRDVVVEQSLSVINNEPMGCCEELYYYYSCHHVFPTETRLNIWEKNWGSVSYPGLITSAKVYNRLGWNPTEALSSRRPPLGCTGPPSRQQQWSDTFYQFLGYSVPRLKRDRNAVRLRSDWEESRAACLCSATHGRSATTVQVKTTWRSPRGRVGL